MVYEMIVKLWNTMCSSVSNFHLSDLQVDDASRFLHVPDGKRNIFVALFGGSAVYVIYRFIRYYQQDIRKLKGPPSSEASLVFGHELIIWQGEANEAYTNWVEKYGSVLKFKAAFGHSDIILAADHAFVRHILADTFKYGRVESTNLLGTGLTWAEGVDHSTQRRLVSPFFTAENIQNMDETIAECAEKLENKLINLLSSSNGDVEINIVPYTSTCTLDVIGRVGFDYDFKSGASPEAQAISNEWHRSVRGSAQKDAYIGGLVMRSFPLLAYIPNKNLYEIGNIRRIATKIAERLYDEKVKALMDNQVGEKDHASRGKDLLSMLVYSKYKEKGSLTKDQIIGNIITLLMVGHETSAMTINFILYSLATNMEVQKKLREEILKSGRSLSHESVNKLEYLDAVVREGLRMYPAGPQTQRMAMEDDIIPLSEPIVASNGDILRSIQIQKGQIIHVPLQTMNTRRSVWGANHEMFRPERWIEPDGVPLPNELPHGWGSTIAFLDGPRNCIGWRLALLEMKIIIATLIRSIEFHDTGAKMKTKVSPTLQPVVNGEAGVIPLRLKFLHS